MKKRKGFSLMECVVSILLTGLIASAAISTMMTTNKLSAKYKKTEAVVRECENILVCCQSGEIELKPVSGGLLPGSEPAYEPSFNATNVAYGLKLLYNDNQIRLILVAGTENKSFTVYFAGNNSYLTEADKAKAKWQITGSLKSDGNITLTANNVLSDGTTGEELYEIEYAIS